MFEGERFALWAVLFTRSDNGGYRRIRSGFFFMDRSGPR